MENKIDRKNGVMPQAIGNLALADVKESTLDNGIPVYTVSGGSQEIVRIEIVFDAGSYYQRVPGQALFCSKLMLEGSENYTAEEIAHITEYYGSYVNSSPEKDLMAFSITSLNKHLSKIIPVVFDVISKPTFPEEERLQLLTSQKNDLAGDLQKPKSRAFLEFQKLIYGLKSQYRTVTDGNEFDLLTRDVIMDFYHKRISPESCRIFVAGLPEQECMDLLNQYFGQKWGEKELEDQDHFILDYAEPHRKKIQMPNALQSSIILGIPVVTKKHEDYHSLDILNTIFGGYFGSRLMSNIREDKGYTYGISSCIVSVQHHAFLYINTEVDGKHTEACLQEIYMEMDRLCNELVSEQELYQVRSNCLGNYIRSLDGPLLQGSHWRNIIDAGLERTYYQDYLETLMTITPEIIQKMAQKYLRKEKLIEVIVGA